MTKAAIKETKHYPTFKPGDEIFALDIDKIFSSDELAAIDHDRAGALVQGRNRRGSLTRVGENQVLPRANREGRREEERT